MVSVFDCDIDSARSIDGTSPNKTKMLSKIPIRNLHVKIRTYYLT